jgi:hypothetical protein
MDGNGTRKLSAIILTPDCFDTIHRTVAALRAQTVFDDIEFVIVAPSRACLDDGKDELAKLDHQVVEVGPFRSTAAARAAGVRRARGDIVVFAEDHCFPAPDWAEHLLESHKDPWAVVGPAMLNANPQRALSWINLATEYGLWVHPVPSGSANHLPGHNSAYKREVLLGYGAELEEMLEAESTLHWDLISKGHRLYLNSNAKTYHLNYSRLGPAFILRFLGGRLFAAARSRKWPVWQHLLYAGTSPLIPLKRAGRIVGDLERIGQQPWRRPHILGLLMLCLTADACGEMVGYLFGSGASMARLTEMEFRRERFMQDDDVVVAEEPKLQHSAVAA